MQADNPILPYSKYAQKLKISVEKTDYHMLRTVLKESTDVSEYLRMLHTIEGNDVVEYFYVLFLNRAQRVVGYSVHSHGGMTGTVCDLRLMMAQALTCCAVGIILCHNHPSGSPKPSKADEDLTSKVRDIAKLMDICLLDHMILGDEREYFSFSDEGIL